MITAIEIENFKGIGERVRVELKPENGDRIQLDYLDLAHPVLSAGKTLERFQLEGSEPAEVQSSSRADESARRVQ